MTDVLSIVLAVLVPTGVLAVAVAIVAAFRISSMLRGLEGIAASWPRFAAAHGLTYSPAGRRFWAGPGLGSAPSMRGIAGGFRVEIEASHLGSTNLRRTFVRAFRPEHPPGSPTDAKLTPVPSDGMDLNELARLNPVLSHRRVGDQACVELRLHGHVHDEVLLGAAMAVVVDASTVRNAVR